MSAKEAAAKCREWAAQARSRAIGSDNEMVSCSYGAAEKSYAEAAALIDKIAVPQSWIPLTPETKLEAKKYYLAWRPSRRMSFWLTGELILMAAADDAPAHLQMNLTHYMEMPEGPKGKR